MAPRMRAAWIAAIAMACASTALGQGSAAPAPLAPADIQLVYEELVHTHDGEAYTLNIVGFASEPLAAAAWKSMTEPPMAGLPLHKVRNNIVPRQRYLFNIEPALRERIVNLRVGERTGPVRTRIGWAIAIEMFGARQKVLLMQSSFMCLRTLTLKTFIDFGSK